jgi:adenosylcobinamide-GDP ribazoletransferase
MPAASVRAAAAAVTFLTRVPAARSVALDGLDVARGVVFFPLVGAGVGAAAGGAALAVHLVLPAFAAAAVAVAVAVVLTGGMHVDALADTADATGGRTRERALEIMRDPRIGSFGASALVLDLLLKVSAVAVLLDRGGVLPALVAAGALSRAASPPLALVLPYPRVEGGPGSVLTTRVGRLSVVATAIVALAVALAAAGVTGAAMAASVAGSAVVLGFVYRRWLGGATGDCLGASTELGETLALLVAAALA